MVRFLFLPVYHHLGQKSRDQTTWCHVMLSVTAVIMKVQMSRRTVYIRSFKVFIVHWRHHFWPASIQTYSIHRTRWQKSILVTTEHEIKPRQTNMTGLHRHTLQYSTVFILSQDCSVGIDQMQATNPQWVVWGRVGTQFKHGGGGREGGRQWRVGSLRRRATGMGAGQQVPSHQEVRVTPPESQ